MAQRIQQGTLNKIKGSVTIASFPGLSVIADNLAKNGITVDPEGEITTLIPTMTGGVNSPNPYQVVSVTLHMLRSQGIADSYKSQCELNSVLGSITVSPDSTALGDYEIENCSVKSITGLDFSAQNADFTVVLQGIYYINSNLFV